MPSPPQIPPLAGMSPLGFTPPATPAPTPEKLDAAAALPMPDDEYEVTFQDLIDHGSVVASSWSGNGFTASVEISMPNGKTYEISAWGDNNDADASSNDSVDMDVYDEDGDSPWSVIDAIAFEHDKFERTQAAAMQLADAARDLLESEADEHADAQAHDEDTENNRCSYCALRAIIQKIDTEPSPKITPAPSPTA